jgi:hypothetical protein
MSPWDSMNRSLLKRFVKNLTRETGRANHLSQYFLSDLGNRLLGFVFLAELCEQQQNPR